MDRKALETAQKGYHVSPCCGRPMRYIGPDPDDKEGDKSIWRCPCGNKVSE